MEESATKLSIVFGMGRATISEWEKIVPKLNGFVSCHHARFLRNVLSQKFHILIKLRKLFFFVIFFKERHKENLLSNPLIYQETIHVNKMMNGDPKFSA